MHANAAWKHPAAAKVQRQAALGKDLGEACGVGGNHQVANEGHVAASANGNAANLGNGGLRNAGKRHAHLGDVAHGCQRMCFGPTGVAAA